VYPFIVAGQRLGKHVPRQGRIVGVVVFYAGRAVSKESRLLVFLRTSCFEMKFPIIVVLLLSETETSRMSGEMSKDLKYFREDRRLRHSAERFEVQQTGPSCRIIAEGNTAKSKGCQTVFTAGKMNFAV
jgi:hypothetical protein